MFKKFICMVMLVGMLFAGSGCMTLIHQVGDGAQGNEMVEKRQWYVLWGLVPINEVDSQELAEGASDYTVTSQVTIIDGLISAVLGWISVASQTVTVEM